jgi:thymidylate synthase
MNLTTYATADEAYLDTLDLVWTNPDARSAPRGLTIRECYDYGFQVDRKTAETFPIKTGVPERDEKIKEYTRKEFLLYKSFTNRAEDFAKASSFWTGLANPDGTVNSNYGRLIFHDKTCGDPIMEALGNSAYRYTYEERLRTPFEWAVLSLLADHDSRQAFIRLSTPRHQWWGNKDQVCTMHLHLRITPPPAGEAGDRLMMTAVMRSNDVVKGLTYDMPFFTYVQSEVLAALRIGRELPYAGFASLPDVQIGPYRHFAHSMHLYDRDREVIESILNHNRG